MTAAENQMRLSANVDRARGAVPIKDIVNAGLKRRYGAERRFRAYGAIAVGVALAMLIALFASIISKGYGAFWRTCLTLPIELKTEDFPAPSQRTPETLMAVDYGGLIKTALREMFPDATRRRDKRALYRMVSNAAAHDLRRAVADNPELIGTRIELTVPASSGVDMLSKGYVDRDSSEDERRIKDNQIAWFDSLKAKGLVDIRFNTALFTQGDSRQPELAGVWGATVGSFFTLAVTLALSFPIGVATAVYLEELAPKNKWTDLIEVNINNLAAVPSIVFGLLGLAVFLQFLGLPRSAPVVGGLVLTLMTLPTIIIAGRAALKSVPPSIREAALGMGASRLQTIFHHVLPLATPGMLTGAIIGMAQALGETAPLLMIGMVAFVADIPASPMDASTVLPVQIYLWADSPERAFVERTSAAIMVLLTFLVLMNAAAVLLRKKFEKRW